MSFKKWRSLHFQQNAYRWQHGSKKNQLYLKFALHCINVKLSISIEQMFRTAH